MNSLEQIYYVIGKLETIKEITVNFDDLSFIFEVLEDNEYFQNYDDEYDNNYDDYPVENENFSEYRGTYASDVAGLSDDFINNVLDGEPEAYWNID